MDGRRAALALSLALGFGAAAQVLFFRQLAGLNVPIATLLFLAFAWRVKGPRPLRARDAWLPSAALVFAAFCAIRADAALVAFDAAAAIGLALATVAAFSGARVGALPAAQVVREVAAIWASVAARGATVLARALPHVATLPRGRVERAARYAAGLLIAAPFLLVFALLFSAADAVFSRALSELVDLRRLREALAEAPGRLAIAAVATWTSAGAFAALWRAPREATPARAGGLLRPESALAALVAIDALFAIFVGLQLAYLFGGVDTMDAAGVTYSAYARRGFFELTWVAALVAVVVFATDRLVRARDRAFVAAALTLLALTAVVLASAAYRLDLYQRAYGWTELRLYALAAIAFLALGLATFGVAIVRDRVAYVLLPLKVAALAVALAMNLVGPQAYVARANVARVIDPSGLPADADRSLDARYIGFLDHGAIAAALARLDEVPERYRLSLALEVRRRVGHGLLARRDDWRSWNLERALAWQAVAAAPAVASGCEATPERDGPPVDHCYVHRPPPWLLWPPAYLRPEPRDEDVRPFQRRT